MKINSTTIPLPIDNIDTDQIIPAKFLKQVDKKGYGKHLFRNWRYSEGDSQDPDFILNKPERKEATILLAGNNFGCGSSREHAAWALADFGIRAIISTQFADIFKGNAYNNGIVPIELEKEQVNVLIRGSLQNPNLKIEIDLENQKVLSPALGIKETFDIHPFKKQCLVEGVNETEFLINLRPEIQEFESKRIQLP
ncbi:MAG: 3-isopropylmalate dehydratase small subunit [Ekhidna sp.]|nr:3-isopropylmalate dehydratase small subunit [Ekhidna sp.]MBC6425296.1 3-isopropylmalate dehydratase small subunit [Ekhidna sp.]